MKNKEHPSSPVSGVLYVDWENNTESKLFSHDNLFKIIQAVLVGKALSFDTNLTGLTIGPKIKRKFKLRLSWEEKSLEGKRILEIDTVLKSKGVETRSLFPTIIPELIKLCEKYGYDEVQTLSLLPERYMLMMGWKQVWKLWKYGKYSISLTKLKYLSNSNFSNYRF